MKIWRQPISRQDRNTNVKVNHTQNGATMQLNYTYATSMSVLLHSSFKTFVWFSKLLHFSKGTCFVIETSLTTTAFRSISRSGLYTRGNRPLKR